MKLSSRVLRVSPSQTMKFTARAKELKGEGRRIISLTAGEPDFRTPDHVCEAAIQAIRDGHHGYTMNTGLPQLRQAICDKLLRDNELSYAPDQIVVSNGAKQSIGFAIWATVGEGDEVVVPAPYWVSYPEMVKLADGTPVIVPAGSDQGFKITPDQLEAAITPATKGLILCSPSNPTGACYTRDELAALGEVLLRHPDVLVYSDEIYEYITFESPHLSIAQVVPELAPRVVVVNGFSKGFAMTGWRLGYLAADRTIAGAVAKLQGQETSAPSTISQMAGLAAYTHPLDQVRAMRDVFRKRRDLMVNGLNAIPGVTCTVPDGAFYVFPDISARIPARKPEGTLIETTTDFSMMCLEEFGLGVVPGDAFGDPSCIRLSFAASDEDLTAGLALLREALDSLHPESA